MSSPEFPGLSLAVTKTPRESALDREIVPHNPEMGLEAYPDLFAGVDGPSTLVQVRHDLQR